MISQEKAGKIAVAATVAGVILVVFLLIVLIIQFVQIGVRRAEKAKLEEEIARLEQQLAQDSGDYSYYSSRQGLLRLAYQSGYKFPTDSN